MYPLDGIDEEMAAEDFGCPICRQGDVLVSRRHVIRGKWVAECSYCGLQVELWSPCEARGYFEELAEYFSKELTILRGK